MHLAGDDAMVLYVEDDVALQAYAGMKHDIMIIN